MTVISRFRWPGAALAVATPLALAVVVAMIAGIGTPMAQDAPGDAVVARVDGDVITEIDLTAAAQEIGEEIDRMPGDRRANLIDVVVNIRLAAKAAATAELDKDPLVAARMALVRDRALYIEYLRGKIGASLTEEAARQRYGEEIAEFTADEQLRARHILVKTEDEAKAIISDLDNGGDFAEIAKEKSTDPGSAPNGGDLDFIGRGDTVKPFEEAAFALAVGEYTKTPVQSPFGWHVIRIDEKRAQPPPPFEQEARRIQADLFAESFDKAIEELRAAATIEVIPAAEPEAPPEGEPAPAANQ